MGRFQFIEGFHKEPGFYQPVIRRYFFVEWIRHLTVSNFYFGTFFLANTHEPLEAEH